MCVQCFSVSLISVSWKGKKKYHFLFSSSSIQINCLLQFFFYTFIFLHASLMKRQIVIKSGLPRIKSNVSNSKISIFEPISEHIYVT